MDWDEWDGWESTYLSVSVAGAVMWISFPSFPLLNFTC